MSGLSRAEIDALVGQMIADERRPATAPTPTPTPTPPRRSRAAGIWTCSVVAVVALVGVLLRHGAAGSALPVYSEAGLPAHPTVYTDGSYVFMQTQPANASLPVGYNPCKHVDVEINYLDATPTIRADVERVVADVNQVSGLHLRYVGASMRTWISPPDGRILVSFADARTNPGMTGDVAGRGGSGWPAYYADQTLYYSGGTVTLNTATFPGQTHDEQLLILAHEFGHAVGLAHAPGAELMNADAWPYGLHHYAHGDLTGLAKLGQLPCH